MRKPAAVLNALFAALLAFGAVRAAQATPPELEKEARTALQALYARSPGAEALGAKAKAILVFPNVHKVAAIVGRRPATGSCSRMESRVFVDAGAAVQMTTASAQADVYTYVYGQKGMMAGISLQGSRISRVGD
jgi:lipid-binding SYLF domain-containing protein